MRWQSDPAYVLMAFSKEIDGVFAGSNPVSCKEEMAS